MLLVGAFALAATLALVAAALHHDHSVSPPHGPYTATGWTFGDRSSLREAAQAGGLNAVSADWLQSRADGSVVAPREVPGFLASVRARHLEPWITLTDYDQSRQRFDPSIAAAILASPRAMRRQVAAVAAWCRSRDVAGLDLDWEALTAEQRDRYSVFVGLLAAALHHDGRRLAVDVFPKTSEPGTWDAPQAQDWTRLGKSADFVNVMTYNYSGSWSGPGPLSPPAWMDAVLSFAATRIAPAKIVMGVGLYGRTWHGSQTADLTWADVQRIVARDHPRRSRDGSGELRLEYSDSGGAHVAYFPDARAVAVKLRMMLRDHPGIAGIACWQMGQADPGVWPRIHQLLH